MHCAVPRRPRDHALISGNASVGDVTQNEPDPCCMLHKTSKSSTSSSPTLKSLILSKLDYGDTVFYPLNASDLKRLQKWHYAATLFLGPLYGDTVFYPLNASDLKRLQKWHYAATLFLGPLYCVE